MYRRLCCLDHFCRIHNLDLLWICLLYTSSNTSRLENNSSSATTDLASDSKLSWQEQKEAQAKERKRANEFKKTEERIGVLEDRSAEIDILMAQEEVYTNSVKCQELAKERAEDVYKRQHTRPQIAGSAEDSPITL